MQVRILPYSQTKNRDMETITKLGLGIAIVLFAAVVLGLPTMWLWNWLMPEIFGLKTITFLQAVGLNFLTSSLFKNTSSSNKE